MKMLNLLLISTAMALVGTACGDDSSSKSSDDDVMDSGKTTVTMTEPAPTTFECDTTTCDVPMVDSASLPEALQSLGPDVIGGFIMLEGCCTEDDDPCGVMAENGCVPQNQEGVPDDACPGLPISVMGFDLTFEGCCRPDGWCGFDLGLIGIGCMEREEAAMTPIMGMSLPDAGMIMAISCGDGGDDAGNDDVDAGR